MTSAARFEPGGAERGGEESQWREGEPARGWEEKGVLAESLV
jgi:hypothetical protein